MVLLRVLPLKVVMRFSRQDKLSPLYIGPFKILRRLRPIAYELALPPVYPTIHLVFHVLTLYHYIPHKLYVLKYDSIELHDHLTLLRSRWPFWPEISHSCILRLYR